MSASIETRQQLQPQPLTIPADFGGLTLKRSSFCDHYILTGNATDATIKAGYTLDRDSAAQIGSRLLRNVKIQAEIKRRLGIAICSPDEVLETLSKHARADLTDVLTADGEFSFARAKARRLLKKLKVKTRTDKDGCVTVEKEFEIHDPQAALEKLGRFHKLFTDRVETESTVDSKLLASEVVQLLVALAERSRAAQLDQPALSPASMDQVVQDQQPAIETTATVVDSNHE